MYARNIRDMIVEEDSSQLFQSRLSKISLQQVMITIDFREFLVHDCVNLFDIDDRVSFAKTQIFQSLLLLSSFNNFKMIKDHLTFLIICKID